MRILFWWIVLCFLLKSYLQLEVKNIPLDKLGLQNNYNDIVRDLIKNWDSPIVYLRQLGYLPNNYEDTSRIKPNLDELISRMEGDNQKSLFRHEQVEKILQKRHNMMMKHRQSLKERTKKSIEPNKPQAPQPVIEKKILPNVDKVLVKKQPANQPDSETKMQQLQQELDRQKVEPLNSASLDRVLGKQQGSGAQEGSVQTQLADAAKLPMDPSDKYLMLLVARTSPNQQPQAMRAGEASVDSPKLAVAPVKAEPKSLVNEPQLNVLSLLPENTAKDARIGLPAEGASIAIGGGIGGAGGGPQFSNDLQTPTLLKMMHYRKAENVEQELSKSDLPFENCMPKTHKDFLWMHVKGGTKLSNVIAHAQAALDKGEYRSLVWSGSGGGVVKTISCAEVLKRSYPLYQVTRMAYTSVEEHWKPQMEGLEEIIVTRQIPTLHILMSLDELPDSIDGLQKPNTNSDFWQLDEAPAGARQTQGNAAGRGNKRARFGRNKKPQSQETAPGKAVIDTASSGQG